MREFMVAVAVVVASCKGGTATQAKSGSPAAKQGLAIPTVGVSSVLGKDSRRPPFLLLVDAAGAVRLAAVASWDELDRNALTISKKPAPLDPLDKFIREEVGLGRDSVASIARWDEESSSNIDLSGLEDTATKTAAVGQEDPPPPPPPEDEAESGGTGTAMAKSDRAEGQYKMQKVQEDPQLARQQAIERARASGILGGPTGAFASLGPPESNADGTPARMAQISGSVIEDGKLEHMRAMVLAAPTLKATKLIEIVRDTQAAIGVSHAGKIRPLRLDFQARGDRLSESPYWLEARVSAKHIVVEAVPDAPIEITDVKELAAALDKARTARGADAGSPVDVLVDADIDSQRLVDLLVALDTAGVRAIGMGMALPAEELPRRGHRMPTVALGQPNTLGDLDKALIRQVVKASKPKLEACFTKALATSPTLSGTVQTQFAISPKGSVLRADASGVDPALAACVAGVVKTLVFPAPKSGGRVQVNYPFTMRP